MNRHHIFPKSRIRDKDKDTDNIVYWEETFHKHFHQLFDNMVPEEIHEFIDVITEPGTVWDHETLKRLRQEIKGE